MQRPQLLCCRASSFSTHPPVLFHTLASLFPPQGLCTCCAPAWRALSPSSGHRGHFPEPHPFCALRCFCSNATGHVSLGAPNPPGQRPCSARCRTQPGSWGRVSQTTSLSSSPSPRGLRAKSQSPGAGTPLPRPPRPAVRVKTMGDGGGRGVSEEGAAWAQPEKLVQSSFVPLECGSGGVKAGRVGSGRLGGA